MLKHLSKRRNRKTREMPKCLPFTSMDSFLHFNDATDEIYNEVVHYLIYLGGLNPVDCAAIYFKLAFENTEKISCDMTWHGTKCLTALKNTRFSQACEDAMSSNLNFSKPRRNEFEDAMIKALKSTKERFRRLHKRKDLENNNNMAGETIESKELVTKKQKQSQEKKEKMQLDTSDNFEQQGKKRMQNNQFNENNDFSDDLELFSNNHFSCTEKKDYDFSVKYDEDLNDSSNTFEY